MVYDLIVLGGGPAGYTAAERAGHAGLTVLLIEKSNVGGVCLNEGCIPTKTLLYSAKIFDNANMGAKYGITVSNITIDHTKVIERKNKVVRTLLAGVKAALKANHVSLLEGNGVIEGKGPEGFNVSVNGETYTGKRLLIATGSSPSIPPIPGLKEGLESGMVLTNRELLDLNEVPEKLVVIGGGVIGLEMASYYTSAGSNATIIEMLNHIGGDNDPELIKLLQKEYEKKGITFCLDSRVTRIESDGVCYEYNGETKFAPASKVLMSVGRRANINGIGLEKLNIMVQNGAIITDDRMMTNVPDVYAAGDVNGKYMLAHTAYREAEVAVDNMLGNDDRMNYDAVPSVIYTNPELASVGETEISAINKGLDIAVAKIPMRFSGRYLAENEGGNGVFKLVFDKKQGHVIGACALGNYSSEFIVACGMIIEHKLTLDDIKRTVFPHPTVCEVIREAAFQLDI